MGNNSWSLTPRVKEVPLPEDLLPHADGIQVVSVKFAGAGRLAKIQRESIRHHMELMDAFGDDKRLDRAAENKGVQKKAEEVDRDPVESVLSQFTPRLVCMFCIKAFNGVEVNGDQLNEWFEEADERVVRHIAVETLQWAGKIPETEEQSKNG